MAGKRALSSMKREELSPSQAVKRVTLPYKAVMATIIAAKPSDQFQKKSLYSINHDYNPRRNNIQRTKKENPHLHFGILWLCVYFIFPLLVPQKRPFRRRPWGYLRV